MPRCVDRQIDRIERMVAHDFQPPSLAPAMDVLEPPVDEIERPPGIDRRARERPEAILQLYHRHHAGRRRRDRPVGRADVELGEFPFPHQQLARHILDRIVERIFAGAQERAAAFVVAGRIAAFGVHMDVAEADVAGIIELHRALFRRIGAGDAIAMIVGEEQVLRIADVERDGVGPVAHLLLGLRREELPVLHIVEHEFVAGMMFDRHFVDMARRAGVADIEAGLGEAVGAPDVSEGAAAPVRYPDAGILRVEPMVGHWIAGMNHQRAQHLAIRGRRAAAAHDLHVLHQALLARSPQQRRRARVDPSGKEAKARKDRVAALAAFQDRQHRAEAGMARIFVRNIELGDGGMQADEHAVGP